MVRFRSQIFIVTLFFLSLLSNAFAAVDNCDHNALTLTSSMMAQTMDHASMHQNGLHATPKQQMECCEASCSCIAQSCISFSMLVDDAGFNVIQLTDDKFSDSTTLLVQIATDTLYRPPILV